MIATRRDSGLSEARARRSADALVADVDAVLIDNRYEQYLACRSARRRKARGIPRVLDLDKPTPPDDALLAGCTHVIASADAMRETHRR